MIINTNSLHIPLVSNCVNCVVTSPPYFGHRDYQTATWVGGDSNCTHIQRNQVHGGEAARPYQESVTFHYKGKCELCGAVSIDNQLGMEDTPEKFVNNLVIVFREIWRVLKGDGVAFLNLGDTYMSSGGASRHLGYSDPKYKNGRNGEHIEPQAFKHEYIRPKSLIGIPWRVALALQQEGWIIRNDIVWTKNNPLPESVTDRFTKSHEYVFMLSKSERYYFNAKAVEEPSVTYQYEKRNIPGVVRDRSHDYDSKIKKMNNITGNMSKRGVTRTTKELNLKPQEDKTYATRNRRDVFNINTKPCNLAHFAVMPEELVNICILAGCPEDGTVLDPFCGAGTTGLVAKTNSRKFIGLELNMDFIKIAEKRLFAVTPKMF